MSKPKVNHYPITPAPDAWYFPLFKGKRLGRVKMYIATQRTLNQEIGKARRYERTPYLRRVKWFWTSVLCEFLFLGEHWFKRLPDNEKYVDQAICRICKTTKRRFSEAYAKQLDEIYNTTV